MVASYAAFVDAGYLRAEGARKLGYTSNQMRPNAAGVVRWLRGLFGTSKWLEFLRVYWYDGQFDANHMEYGSQRRFLDAIAYTPGVQVRLGHLVERRPRLERPVRRALESTAAALGMDQRVLLEEFDRHFTFRPRTPSSTLARRRFARCSNPARVLPDPSRAHPH